MLRHTREHMVLVSSLFLYLNPFCSSASQEKQSSHCEPDKQIALRERFANVVAICITVHIAEGISKNDTTNGNYLSLSLFICKAPNHNVLYIAKI